MTRSRPIDPGPSRWDLPDPAEAEPGEQVVAIGGDLAPSTLIAAYRTGLFPMHLTSGELGWWSPDPRGILPLDGMRISRSLRKSAARMRCTIDDAFERVIRECSAARPGESWITEEFVESYCRLHQMGWAHSVEVWDGDALVGGLYGVEVGGLFAGESMFHLRRDGSKVALLHLVHVLRECPGKRLLDVQWRTEHLGTLGVVEIPRPRYLELLGLAIETEPCLAGG